MEKSIPNLPHLLYTVHTELTPEVNIFHRQDKYTRPTPQQHQQHMYPRDVIARRCLRACAKSILIFQKYNFKLNFPGKRRQNFLISACLFQGGKIMWKTIFTKSTKSSNRQKSRLAGTRRSGGVHPRKNKSPYLKGRKKSVPKKQQPLL